MYITSFVAFFSEEEEGAEEEDVEEEDVKEAEKAPEAALAQDRGQALSLKSPSTHRSKRPPFARSPVIVKQTKLGSRSSALKKVVVGYLVYRYVIKNAPVYRVGYPMYRRYVSIPEKRAVRVTYEEEKLLDANGNLCLLWKPVPEKRSLREGIEKNLIELKTTVKNKNTGQSRTYSNNTDIISLDDMNGQDFVVLSRVRYNTTIVEGTSCTQVEKKVEGTMITLYQTNPNEANLLYVNHKLFATVILLFSVSLIKASGKFHVSKR